MSAKNSWLKRFLKEKGMHLDIGWEIVSDSGTTYEISLNCLLEHYDNLPKEIKNKVKNVLVRYDYMNSQSGIIEYLTFMLKSIAEIRENELKGSDEND